MQPLADRLRPQNLAEVIGQDHLTAKGRPLYQALQNQNLHSIVFWGPPGTGKTTLARILCQHTESEQIKLSAILSGVADIRKAIAQAELNQQQGKRTVLFVDEIHRFNKSQQDAFLPHMENGLITLIGATTENPSFALNNALLSRLRVYVLKSIQSQDLEKILKKGLKHTQIHLNDQQKSRVLNAADGDASRLLSMIAIIADLATGSEVKDQDLNVILSGQARRFDNHGDVFYEQISALHKTIRSSNPDAALYWLSRMLDGGCDPQYLARRLLRIASEDVGNADPRALSLCLDAWDTFKRLGSPEGELALAQAAVYLACCPKSNAVYNAFGMAMNDAKQSGSIDVPKHLRNAPTQLMKNQGYGEGYQYDHNSQDGVAYSQKGFPNELGERLYYQPKSVGLEQKIAEKLQHIRSKRNV